MPPKDDNPLNDNKPDVEQNIGNVTSLDSTNQNIIQPTQLVNPYIPPVMTGDTAQQQTPKPKSKMKWILIMAVFIILIVLAILVYLFVIKKPIKTSSSPSTSSSVGTKTSGNVAIDYVTIKTGVKENNGNSDQAATSSGHYAYIDSSLNGTQDAANGGKVIYDGNIVYYGADVVQDQISISKNGLHYVYAKDNGTNYEIYIDNKSVNSSIPDNTNLNSLAVSDNGKDYAYQYLGNGAAGVNGYLYKNNNVLYKGPILYPVFSGDLNNYVGYLNSGIVVNGKYSDEGFQAASDADFGNNGISENGQHYYAIGQSSSSTALKGDYPLIVDGKVITALTFASNAAITNSGNYYYLNLNSSELVVNNKTNLPYPKNTLPSNSDNWNLVNATVFSTINDNASHYALGESDSTNSWAIDGKQAKISGDIYHLEFDSSNLYVYRWSN